MSEYADVYEIANKYAARAESLVCPISFKKPIREQFKDNSTFGMALDEYEIYYHSSFIPAKKEYREALERITQSFKRDLLEFLEVGEEKADTLWNLAWEYGHSGGYNEVAIHAENLVELLR